jgi:hypothetical protein
MDIGLNEDFDVVLDDRNDLPLVEGREAFEQRLAIRSTAYFHQIVGSANRGNLLSLVEIQAERVANDAEGVDRVIQVEAAFSENEPNTIEVTAIYETGDDFTFSISE